MLKIQLWTRLHSDIYKSLGGGEARLQVEYAYGPRNLVRAYRELLDLRERNKRNYGNIGCGHSWLQTTDGRVLDTWLVSGDWGQSHAELVEDIEGALLPPDAWDEADVAASQAVEN